MVLFIGRVLIRKLLFFFSWKPVDVGLTRLLCFLAALLALRFSLPHLNLTLRCIWLWSGAPATRLTGDLVICNLTVFLDFVERGLKGFYFQYAIATPGCICCRMLCQVVGGRLTLTCSTPHRSHCLSLVNHSNTVNPPRTIFPLNNSKFNSQRLLCHSI